MFNLVWTKNSSFHVTQTVKIQSDKCGHFAIYEDSFLKVFFGTQGQKVEGFDKDMHHHFLPEKGIPKQMNVDASSVRIGHNFWIVGGSKECSTFGTFGNFG